MPTDRKVSDLDVADRFSPCTPRFEDGCFHGGPDMAELRYRLLVRRGQAWGNKKPLAPSV